MHQQVLAKMATFRIFPSKLATFDTFGLFVAICGYFLLFWLNWLLLDFDAFEFYQNLLGHPVACHESFLMNGNLILI